MTVDATIFRSALGRFASGITVVTTLHADARPLGVTISAFASVSLEPPLILFCLGHGSGQIGDFVGCTRFAVNLLSEGQVEASEVFASHLADKFERVAWHRTRDGYVLLEGCLAAIKCERETTHEAGDHTIILGRVHGIEGLTNETGPLLRYRGAYHGIGEVVEG